MLSFGYGCYGRVKKAFFPRLNEHSGDEKEGNMLSLLNNLKDDEFELQISDFSVMWLNAINYP